MDNMYCPRCGSQLATAKFQNYCDACGAEFMPGDRLSERQRHNWSKLPYNLIVWGFGILGGAAMALGVIYGLTVVPVADYGKRLICMMLFVSAGAAVATVVYAVAWAVVHALFGRVAAQPMDRALCSMLCLAGACGFWPLLACLMAAL